jgi:hypothetical protein
MKKILPNLEDIDLEILNMILLLIKIQEALVIKFVDFINEGGLAQKLANLNLSNTLSNLAFTPAYGDIPTKEEREGLDSFNNLVSDTVMAEPNQFQDYPGDKNLGSVQDQNLGS